MRKIRVFEVGIRYTERGLVYCLGGLGTVLERRRGFVLGNLLGRRRRYVVIFCLFFG